MVYLSHWCCYHLLFCYLSIVPFTFTFHFHALENEMAPHSSVLAWRIPGMGEPLGLPSMGSHRVGHDWSNLAAAATAIVSVYLGCYNKISWTVWLKQQTFISQGCGVREAQALDNSRFCVWWEANSRFCVWWEPTSCLWTTLFSLHLHMVKGD